MSEPREFLRDVYDLTSQGDTDDYYSRWASTYDDELTRQEYRTPRRCADALEAFVAPDDAVLDIGCGTGLSGAALAAVGFSNVTGTDVNPEMLAVAAESGMYQDTWLTDVARPFPFPPGTYSAIAAVGVIGIGAAPPSLLRQALDALEPGGHFVFSYNDHALANLDFRQALDSALADGIAEQVFAEHGPHITGLSSSSTVFVLQRR